MDIDARRFYGIGVLVLGLGNFLFGVGQLLGGPQSWPLALVEMIAGLSLLTIGWLVVSDSDRISRSKLSDRLMLVVGGFGLLTGLFLGLGGVLLVLG